MNDEMQQMRHEIFDRIILALALISLASGLTTLVMGGLSSPGLLYLAIILIMAGVTFVLRRTGRFMVAVYVLIVELLGLVAGLLLQFGLAVSFTPYLLIPIIVIAGLLLGPVATLTVAISSIAVVLVIVILTQPLTASHFMALLPPVGLSTLIALLAIQSGRYVARLDSRLWENRKLLRERTLEMLKITEEAKELQEKAIGLKEQLLKAQAEARRTGQVTTRRGDRLYELIQGTIQELNTTTKKLENVISSVAEIAPANGQGGLLAEAWQKIDHLTSLAISLEEVAQLEHETVQLNYQPINVTRMISELIGTIRGLAREKNLELRYQVFEDLPPLLADPMRVRQALLQIMSNAVKYTDQGVIEVHVEAAEHNLMIFISDTGIGMQPDEVEAIFQNFGRSHSSLAIQRQGPGLGLVISKRLIELHGGRIWATSVAGVGSTFYITLPFVSAQHSLPAALPAATPAVREPTKEPLAIPAPVAVIDQEAAMPAWPGGEDTLVSLPGSAAVVPAQPHFSPVARFSPTYINRFGLILLGLFLAVAGVVTLLAIVNGPTQDEAAAEMAEPVALSTWLNASSPTPPVTLKGNGVVLVPAPVSPTASQPTATATLPPTLTPTPATVTVSPISTTQELTLPTPTPTPFPPTATPTPTPEPTRPASPTPVILPTATPDPGLLSFVTNRAGYQALALLPAGRGLEAGLEVAAETVVSNGLSWSPTGQLLFTGDSEGGREIYVTQAACLNPSEGCDSQPLNLTQAAGDDLQPAWSPDGRRIAFSSGRSGNFDIYVMAAACAGLAEGCEDGLRRLTTSRGFDEWPAWSPDGRKIAFVSDRDGNVEVYTMNADGSDPQRLTDHPADDWPVAWSPDGRWLLFASNRDSNWNMYIVAAGGGPAARLTNDPANERDPAWSPDGRTIAFAYDGNGNWDIYTLPAPAADVAEVPRSAWQPATQTPTDERYPAWLP